MIVAVSGDTQATGAARGRDRYQQDGDRFQLSPGPGQGHAPATEHQLLQSDHVTGRPEEPQGERRETDQGDLRSSVWKTTHTLPG